MFRHIHFVNGSIQFYELQPYLVSQVTRTWNPLNSNNLTFPPPPPKKKQFQQFKDILIKNL